MFGRNEKELIGTKGYGCQKQKFDLRTEVKENQLEWANKGTDGSVKKDMWKRIGVNETLRLVIRMDY